MDTIVLDVTLSGCVNILSKGKLKGLYTYRPAGETESFVATRCYAPGVFPLGLRYALQNRGYKPLLQEERNA